MPRFRFAILAFCLALAASPPPALAADALFSSSLRSFAPADGNASPPDGDIPWRVSADSMTSLDGGAIVEASGNVVLERGDDFLKADFARYFTSTDWVFIRGNVTVRMGRDELLASEAEFDLAANTGWLKNGSVFMSGPHIYFAGDHVTKHYGDRYSFQNAKVTACDGPVPAWSLKAEEAVVEIDGYATLRHSAFQIRDTSIMAAPYLILPAKTTRQTGLLRPDAGVSSWHGAYYTQPWFFALDQSRDLTLYGTWLEKTGFMPTLEYRSVTGDQDKIWLSLDLLYDNNPVSNDAQDPIDSTDGKIRDNYFRYWLRGMGAGQLGQSPWRYAYNLDYVSDQNYLREFEQRMTGFDATRSATFGFFGRDLEEVDQNRVTEGFVYRDWQRWRLTFGGRYEQDPSLGHGNAPLSSDTTAQHLPELNAYYFKGRLWGDLPLEAEASGSAAYMFRRTGTSGLRAEIFPRLSLPLDLTYFTLIPSAGLRQTFYASNVNRPVSPLSPARPDWDAQTGVSRTLPDVGLTALTQASRIWKLGADAKPLAALPENAGQNRWTGLRHTIQPRLSYAWVPNVDQSENPFYTLDDRILPTHLAYFTLTNLFTVSRQTVVAETGANGQAVASLRPDYLDILRVRFGMGYDFNEAGRTLHLDVYPRRPVTDVLGDVEFTPLPWLSFWARAYVSVYGDGITRNDQGITLSHPRWGSLSTSYSARTELYDYINRIQYHNAGDIRFDQPLELLNNTAVLNLSPNWQIGLLSSDDLNTGDNYERRVSLSYIDQCYRLTGRFVSKGREQSWQFSIELLGLN